MVGYLVVDTAIEPLSRLCLVLHAVVARTLLLCGVNVGTANGRNGELKNVFEKALPGKYFSRRGDSLDVFLCNLVPCVEFRALS